MPRLVRLYIKHCLVGFVLSAAFVAALLWFNVANLGHLVATSPVGWIAVMVLFVSNGIVFAGTQFGIVVMGMAERDDDDPVGGKRLPVAEPVPVPVPVAVPAQERRVTRR
ncbi:MAG: hypothetical protein D6688_07890 [Alphaproteobacteria bacterium]|nr:MAG: hypothetical protein D6688_07890 [Alphaproteobacteria bacterium]